MTLNEQLLEAAKKGDIKSFDALVKQGADVSFKDANGDTCLLWAANNGHIDMLEHLIKNHGCKITETNKDGCTALLSAACNDKIEMLDHLIKNHGRKITETNNFGYTAILSAAANGKIEMLEHLIKNHGCKITETNKNGNTALLLAAYNGKIEMLKHLLLKPEVSLQERNTAEGDNALSLAAWYGQIDTVRFLLEQGAYINLLLNDGRSPRVVIENHNDKACLPLLQAAERLMDLAAKGIKEGFEQAEQAVSTLGTALNARRIEDGNTALHLAIIKQDVPLVKFLLEKRASIDIQNKDLMNPYQLAETVDNECIQSMLTVAKVERMCALLDNDKGKQATLELKEKKESNERKEQMESGNSETIQRELSSLIEKALFLINALEIKTSNNKDNSAFKDIKEGLTFKLGMLLSNGQSKYFNPMIAYQYLSSISKDNPQFQKANETCYQLLMGGHLLLEAGLSERGLDAESGDAEPDNVSISAKDVVGDSMSFSGAIESEESRLLRLRTAIKHLLLSNSQDKAILGKLVAEYALGSEFSMTGIPGLTGNDINTQLALIDKIRNMNLENLKIQEKAKREAEEAQRQKQEAQKRVENIARQKEEEIQKLKDEIERLKREKMDQSAPAGNGSFLTQFRATAESASSNNAAASTFSSQLTPQST